jgi:acylphosphatase
MGNTAEGPRVISAARQAVRLRITGWVQGVGYRDWLVETAAGLELAGWVRNRPDGAVEAHAEGPPADLDRLAERCRSGPRLARVEQVRADPQPVEGHQGFVRRPTG